MREVLHLQAVNDDGGGVANESGGDIVQSSGRLNVFLLVVNVKPSGGGSVLTPPLLATADGLGP